MYSGIYTSSHSALLISEPLSKRISLLFIPSSVFFFFLIFFRFSLNIGGQISIYNFKGWVDVTFLFPILRWGILHCLWNTRKTRDNRVIHKTQQMQHLRNKRNCFLALGLFFYFNTFYSTRFYQQFRCCYFSDIFMTLDVSLCSFTEFACELIYFHLNNYLYSQYCGYIQKRLKKQMKKERIHFLQIFKLFIINHIKSKLNQ